MKATETEIGKVYVASNGASLWITRISQTHGAIIQNGTNPRGVVTKLLEDFAANYKLSSIADLNANGLAEYHKYFPPTPKSCTCDISNLMIQGCTCGWIALERKQ